MPTGNMSQRTGTTSIAMIGLLVLVFAMMPALLMVGSPTQADGESKPAPAVDEAAQKEALDFARQHAPALAKVLEDLQTQKSPKFAAAIRGLLVEKRRLDRVEERFPDRYETALVAWKRNVEVRRLTAQWSMSRDPELEDQVRALLLEEKRQRISELKQESARLRERLAAMNAEIEAFDTDQETVIEAEWTKLTRRYSAQSGKRNRSANTRNQESERSGSGKKSPTDSKVESDRKPASPSKKTTTR